MAVTIARTPMVDDDGSGTTGTIINNAWKQEFYSQIDAALAAIAAAAGAGVTTGAWTPGIRGASGSGQTYADRGGTWARVGVPGAAILTAFGFVSLSNKGTLAGALELDGWPQPFPAMFVSVNFGNAYSLATPWSSLAGMSVAATTRVGIFGFAAGGAGSMTALQASDLTNTSTFMFQGTYFTTT